MVRSFGSVKHTLPDNPTWIEFPRSDGSPDKWPAEQTPVVRGGEVNWYREVPLDESSAINWRKTIGQAVAIKLGMDEDAQYVLKAWPAYYKFFDHNKGPKDSPRHDPYLIGCKTVGRFRSCPEFIPHAIWLMTDDTMDPANCQCKYCSKTPQLVISQRQGLSTARSSATPTPSATTLAAQSVSSGGRPVRVARVPRAKPEPQTSRGAQLKNYLLIATRKARQERDLLPKTSACVPIVANRDSDVRAVSREPSRALLRWHRPGELVWVKIRPAPINDKIVFWPAIVTFHQTKGEQMPLPLNHDDKGQTPSRATWAIRQRTEYLVKMLGVGDDDYNLEDDSREVKTRGMQTARDDDVFPYQIYGVPKHIWREVRSSFNGINTLDREAQANYDPFMSSASVEGYQALSAEVQRYAEEQFCAAALPFSAAVGVASRLATHWTPTDMISDSIKVPRPKNFGPGPAVVTKHEFHGMWWGPERIWVDDLIRLKVVRADYAPNGSEFVHHPAGPGPAQLRRRPMEPQRKQGDDERIYKDLGAGCRGLLFRIHSIYALDPPAGKVAEVKLVGMLYELIDDDWDESMVSIEATLAHTNKEATIPQVLSGASTTMGRESTKVDPSSTPSGQSPEVNAPGLPVDAQPGPPRMSRPPWISSKPLPPPPPGFRFRSILKDEMEAEIPVSIIAGRYYPFLHIHPGMDEALAAGVDPSADNASDESRMLTSTRFISLCGLTSGLQNSVAAQRWQRSRRIFAETATAEERLVAQRVLTSHQSGGEDVDMQDE